MDWHFFITQGFAKNHANRFFHIKQTNEFLFIMIIYVNGLIMLTYYYKTCPHSIIHSTILDVEYNG
jgi:hypothetical protein